jgi:hypothetical protein
MRFAIYHRSFFAGEVDGSSANLFCFGKHAFRDFAEDKATKSRIV